MGSIEVGYHLRYERDQANCATTAMHALLPRLPSIDSVEALQNDNTRSLSDIFHILYHEFGQRGDVIAGFELDSDIPPSRFFYRIAHNARHTNGALEFKGGLLLTHEVQCLHVIAVTGVHESKIPKFHIVDTAPHSHGRSIIRKVTSSFLNRRIIPLEACEGRNYGPRAMAIIGMPLVTMQTLPGFTPNIRQEVEFRATEAAVNKLLLLQRAGEDICNLDVAL